MLWLIFRVRTPGAHGAYPHLSRSATKIAARLVTELEALEALTPRVPDQVARIMGDPAVRAAIERGLGKGATDVVPRLTVNIGVLQGGVPAYVYGCSPDRMGAPDERVPIDEFLHIVRIHALSAFDYLT